MPTKDLRALSPEDLAGKEGELREELARLNMKRRAGRLDRSSALRQAKKELARVLTLVAERARAAAQETV